MGNSASANDSRDSNSIVNKGIIDNEDISVMMSSCGHLRHRLCVEGSSRKNIDTELILMRQRELKVVKILLLGPAESGKSTIIKQINNKYCKEYTLEDRSLFKQAIYSSTIQGMVLVLRAMVQHNINFVKYKKLADVRKFFRILSSSDDTVDLKPELAKHMKSIMEDVGVLHCISKSNEFQLFDSAAYFLMSIDRIAHPDYVPTFEDVLKSRIKTTGIVELSFDFRDRHFRLIDVGGQRTERRKWIHCFDEVTAVIFVAALSDYHLRLEEDPTTNRMRESLNVFESIVKCPHLVNSALILFLNKADVFEESIRSKSLPLWECFADYAGDNGDVDAAKSFVKSLFERIYDSSFGGKVRLNNPCSNYPERVQVAIDKLYTHFTCATDTENISFVFEVTSDFLIRQILAKVGLF